MSDNHLTLRGVSKGLKQYETLVIECPSKHESYSGDVERFDYCPFCGVKLGKRP